MRIFRNIRRLPEIYVPLFAIVLILTLLVQVAFSVLLSCNEALERFGTVYPATAEVSLKEMINHERTETGGLVMVNLNDKVIDRNLLDYLGDHPNVTSVDYFTIPHQVPNGIMDNLVSAEKYEEMLAKSAAGEDFYLPNPDSAFSNPYFQAFSSESLIYDANNCTADGLRITYTNGGTLDGLILPKGLYDFFGGTDTLVYGWQYRTFPVQEGYDPVEDAKYFSKSYAELFPEASPAPATRLPVAGYFETELKGFGNTVFCDVETWIDIYQTEQYYLSYWDKELSAAAWDDLPSFPFDPEKYDPLATLGLEYVRVTLDSPANIPSSMQDWIDHGMDPTYYNMIADDYDYKFATGQVQGIRSLTSALVTALSIFSVMMTMIILLFSIRRRRNEIYTLRTLGISGFRIRSDMAMEFGVVMLASIAVGIAGAFLFGSLICTFIEARSLAATEEAMARIADSLTFMQDADVMTSELQAAFQSYTGVGVDLSYRPSAQLWLIFLVAVMISVLFVWTTLIRYTKIKLMKREEF